MASITTVSASPATTVPGGVSIITPVVNDPDGTATITVTVDGSSGTTSIALHEPLVYTVDQTKLTVKGYVVGTLITGQGTLTVGADGASFVYTSA